MDGTVAELLDDYLRSATFERVATAASYRLAFLPVRAWPAGGPAACTGNT